MKRPRLGSSRGARSRVVRFDPRLSGLLSGTEIRGSAPRRRGIGTLDLRTRPSLAVAVVAIAVARGAAAEPERRGHGRAPGTDHRATSEATAGLFHALIR